MSFEILPAHLAFNDDRGPVRIGRDCGGTVAYYPKPHGHNDPALVQPRVVEAAKALPDAS